jgi:hypothetical protein
MIRALWALGSLSIIFVSKVHSAWVTSTNHSSVKCLKFTAHGSRPQKNIQSKTKHVFPASKMYRNVVYLTLHELATWGTLIFKICRGCLKEPRLQAYHTLCGMHQMKRYTSKLSYSSWHLKDDGISRFLHATHRLMTVLRPAQAFFKQIDVKCLVYRQLSANFMVVTTILFAHTTFLWVTCCLMFHTNR